MAIAVVQVEAWEAAYRGLIPDDVIDARTVETRTAQWRARIPDARLIVLVACDENCSVQGFASAQRLAPPDPGFQAFLQTLYVRPQSWGKGIGRKLLAAMCSRLAARGVRNVALRTMRLGDARHFYERLGARVVPNGIMHEAGEFDDVVYAFDDVAGVAALLKRRSGQPEDGQE
ncbi:MAG: GNAT family N-acetyltransferase [Candidatus Eremiobacteraeota bacterium]|nr:GNAT family N-acetyltransferase [Candidatus Eremiobacteraeota bacterium]